jgi:hypothetical protein
VWTIWTGRNGDRAGDEKKLTNARAGPKLQRMWGDVYKEIKGG